MCGKEKLHSEFYTRKDRKNKYYSYCKKCFNSLKTKEFRIKKVKAIAFLGGICYDCKKTFHPSVFDFHHLDPDIKEHTWHSLQKKPERKRNEELNKCVLLCSNCHRLRHYGAHDYPSIQSVEMSENIKNKKTQQSSYCKLCGSVVYKYTKTNLCKSCSGLNRNTKIDWPADEKLLSMIYSTNINSVAKKLGVCWTSVRKRLKRRNLL